MGNHRAAHCMLTAMRFQLILLSLFAASAFAAPQGKDAPPKDPTEKEFEKEFNELFSDSKEEEKAAETLAKEEAEIDKDHEEFLKGESPFDEMVNALSDIPLDDFEAEKEGGIPDPKPKGMRMERHFPTGIIEEPEELRVLSPEDQAYLDRIYSELDRYTPSSYDARDYGIITSPKNQMSCGSCAAFAATSVHETCLAKAGTPFSGLDLSEQQLVDCGYDPNNGMNGCNGAYITAYPKWMAANGANGVSHEAQYPYLDTEPYLTCKANKFWNTGSKFTKAVVDYQCTEDNLKKLVYKYGAVETGIYASTPSFGNYKSGVYNGCTSSSINHAVTVVGYGNENGMDYWIVKNSWGASWGDKGYIKMYRGNRQCGIAGTCVAMECADNGAASPAPVAPPPPPIPASQVCDISKLFGSSGITGNYNLTVTSNGKKYYSDVTCNNSKCSPRVAGPSNACMYICGKTQC